MRILLVVGVLAGCGDNSATPPSPTAIQGGDGCDAVEVSCDVRINCGGAITHAPVTLCSGSTDAAYLAFQAQAQEINLGVCPSAASTYKAVCEVPQDAYECPAAFELELDNTVCVPGQHYDAPAIADVCTHLPTNAGACSVACDADALKAFAVQYTFTTYACTSTDGIAFVAGARP